MVADDTSEPGYLPSPLDPADWTSFRNEAHRLLDACIDHLADVRQRPWRPLSEADREPLRLDEPTEGCGIRDVVDALARNVLPFASGNTHPRFFGWVQGSGLASGLLSEMIVATMNSNCGGRDHGAVYVERAVIDWCRRCFGFPSQASGILVSGTSQATVTCLAAARLKALGTASRFDGLQGTAQLATYAVEGVHNATGKALELLGIGSSTLRRLPQGPGGGIDILSLSEAIARDRAAGLLPFCVVGTAGSVDLGCFDDLNALADVCAAENLWLHVDGAFGAWARLARAPWCDLVDGIERADSLAFDFHKWMFVQYDCGVALIRDEAIHRATFAARPAYLAQQDLGLGGGEPWYCDYGTDLSRGFRALKVWTALRAYGTAALGQAITRNCELAAQMARLVETTHGLRLSAPVRLNVCCFSAAPREWEGPAQDDLNAKITSKLQLSGDAVFSTTKLDGRTVIRAAITNHRTCAGDVAYAISAVARVRDAEVGRQALL